MVRYIYFDLGNVLLTFDHGIASRQIAELLGADVEAVQKTVFESGLQNRYETGLVSCDEFCETILSELKAKGNHASILRAASDIFELNMPIVPLACQLAVSPVPIGILSNTCKAHWNFVTERYTLVRKYFKQRILSYEEKSMKPESKIYEAAIKLAGVPADQIFFMDDRAENVQGALDAGIDAVQFTSVPQLLQELRRREVPFNF